MGDEASQTSSNRASTLTILQLILLLSAAYEANSSRIENKFTKILNNRILTTFEQVSATSVMVCCSKCNVYGSACTGFNFQKTTGRCELSSVPLKDVAVESVTDATWVTYGIANPADWIVAFHAIADIGTDVYEAFMRGTDTTSHDVNCMLPNVTSCNTHFRNKLLDTWAALDVSEVRVSLYKNQMEVAYILFDGTGSSLARWFAPQRVMNSTWIGIDDPSLEYWGFNTLEGFVWAEGLKDKRLFFINHYFGGCDDDPMVLMVLSSNARYCSYDFQSSYPKIFYSVSNTWGNIYTAGQIDSADSFMVSIRVS